jgi:glycosyltransferase involved in cell wall biosynthesis
MDTPLVSVVIPTKNRPPLVMRAVRSVLSQTEKSFEILVVIDGPDRPTEIALADIHDQRLRVIVLPVAGGAPAARNAGFAAAKGGWVALLDDDDEWLHNKLARQLQACRASSFFSPIVASGLIARTPRADFVWPRIAPKPGEAISEYLTVRSSLFAGERVVQTSTVMARRDLFLSLPYAEGLRRHQDWDWLLRAMKIPGVGLEFVHEPLVIWHIEENRQAISSNEDWVRSFGWANENRGLLTDRSYAAFLLVFVASMAAKQRMWNAFLPLLTNALRSKGARPIDLLLFAGIWLFPAEKRSRLRAFFSATTNEPVAKHVYNS